MFFYLDFNGAIEGIVYTARFFISMIFSLVLFETMSFWQLLNAFEGLEKFFPFFKKRHFSLIISLTINFIPQIFITWHKINRAARARSTKNQNVIKKTYSFIMQFFALLSCLLQSAKQTRKAVLNRGFF
ncbi:MAG: CbiQ family ECF transporter T component [Treponemataceae bacterium]